MLKFISPIGLFIGLLFFSACSESLEPEPISFYHIFTGQTQKTWVVTSGYEVGPKEEYNLDLNPCTTDDRYTFFANADRRIRITTGTQRCNGESTTSDVHADDTWSFVNATSTLTFPFPVLTNAPVLPFIVRSVTESTMVLEIYLDQDNLYYYRFTLSAVKE